MFSTNYGEIARGAAVSHDALAPKRWRAFDCNIDRAKLHASVKAHGRQSRRAPYRGNRRELFFNGRLGRTTDELFTGPVKSVAA